MVNMHIYVYVCVCLCVCVCLWPRSRLLPNISCNMVGTHAYVFTCYRIDPAQEWCSVSRRVFLIILSGKYQHCFGLSEMGSNDYWFLWFIYPLATFTFAASVFWIYSIFNLIYIHIWRKYKVVIVKLLPYIWKVYDVCNLDNWIVYEVCCI